MTIKVVDGEDDGKVKLTVKEPQEGKAVTASLSDEDGGETKVSWQWYEDRARSQRMVTTLALTQTLSGSALTSTK